MRSCQVVFSFMFLDSGLLFIAFVFSKTQEQRTVFPGSVPWASGIGDRSTVQADLQTGFPVSSLLQSLPFPVHTGTRRGTGIGEPFSILESASQLTGCVWVGSLIGKAFKSLFGSSTDGTLPILREFVETGSARDFSFAIPLIRVVDAPAIDGLALVHFLGIRHDLPPRIRCRAVVAGGTCCLSFLKGPFFR